MTLVQGRSRMSRLSFFCAGSITLLLTLSPRHDGKFFQQRFRIGYLHCLRGSNGFVHKIATSRRTIPVSSVVFMTPLLPLS